MKMIKAGEVKLPANHLAWGLMENLIMAFYDSVHDMVPVDIEWLLRDIEPPLHPDADNDREIKPLLEFAQVLDDEPLCAGWRELDLLYFWPQ